MSEPALVTPEARPTADRSPRPVPPTPVPTRRPSRRGRALVVVGTFLLIVTLWWGSGYVLAYTDDAYVDSDVVSVTPQVEGPVQSVEVGDNQWVKRGSLLFTIDATPFQLELQQASAREGEAKAQLPIDEAAIASLRAQGEAAAEAARLAALTLDRVRPLSRTNDIPQQAYDEARIAQAESVARQQGAQAALERAENVLRLHQVAVATAHTARLYADWRLSQTRVFATVDGSVTDLSLAPGDHVSPGAPVLAIVDADAWRVIANYKEYYLRHLRSGHPAWVWLDTDPWHVYRARIQGIAHGISRQQQAPSLVRYVSPTVDWIRLDRRVPVRLQLVDPPLPENLFMGADARVVVLY